MAQGPKLILEELKKCGIKYLATLPDNWLKEILELVASDPDFVHIPMAREDEGIGICAGLYFAGKESALIIQNSGLFLCCNAIEELGIKYRLPIFMLVSNRGDLYDDAGFHVTKALITGPLMDALGVHHFEVQGPEEVGKISLAHRFCKLSQMPVVVLLGKEVLAG